MKRQFVTYSSLQEGACHDRQGHGEAPWLVSRQGGGGWGRATWARAFIVVFAGKNGQGRVSRFRIGKFE